MKTRKQKPRLTPRNPLVALAHQRQAGAHGKTRKAERRQARVRLQQGSDD